MNPKQILFTSLFVLVIAFGIRIMNSEIALAQGSYWCYPLSSGCMESQNCAPGYVPYPPCSSFGGKKECRGNRGKESAQRGCVPGVVTEGTQSSAGGGNPGNTGCNWRSTAKDKIKKLAGKGSGGSCRSTGSTCSSGYSGPAWLNCNSYDEQDCESVEKDVVYCTLPPIKGGPLSIAKTANQENIAPREFSLKNPLNFNNLADALNAIAKFLYTISIPIVTVMVLLGGLQILIAAGSVQQIEAGKRTLLYAVIGFVVILVAGGIAQLIGSIIGG